MKKNKKEKSVVKVGPFLDLRMSSVCIEHFFASIVKSLQCTDLELISNLLTSTMI